MSPLFCHAKFAFSLILTLFVCLAQPHLAGAAQDPAQETGEISQASIEELLSDLENPQKLESLKQDLRTLLEARRQARPEKPDVDAGGLLGQVLSLMSGYVQTVNQALAEAGRHLLEIPSAVAGSGRKGAGHCGPESVGRNSHQGPPLPAGRHSGAIPGLTISGKREQEGSRARTS